MFNVRRFRGGFFVRRSYAVAGIAVAFLLAAQPADAAPHSGQEEPPPPPVSEEQQPELEAGAERDDLQSPGPAPKKSGATGCTVVSIEKGYLRSYEYESVDGSGRRSTTVSSGVGGDGKDGDLTTNRDSDEISAGSVGSGVEYDNEEIVDGKVELENGPANVYEVTGCSNYAEGQTEIVVSPEQATYFIPGARQYLSRRLLKPELILEPFDDETDSTFVQTAVDFRTNPAALDPIVFTADTGGPDTALVNGQPTQIRRWMTVTAVPRLVVFESGDPLADETRAECTPEQAVEPYVPETPGACSYRYLNSSSVETSNAFDAVLSVEWDVTFVRNDGPSGSFEIQPSFNNEQVRVGEIKVVNI